MVPHSMRLPIFFAFILTVVTLGLRTDCLAATVSCEVKEVIGSNLVLENCDERLVKEFKKGNKVKVKQQKKEN